MVFTHLMPKQKIEQLQELSEEYSIQITVS